MEQLPAELLAWLEQSRAWPTLPRGRVFLDHVRQSLSETFGIDRGCIVLQRSGRLPNSVPGPPAIEAYWGFPDEDREAIQDWFAREGEGRPEHLFDGRQRWLGLDDISLSVDRWQRWGLDRIGRWTIEPYGGLGGSMLLGRTRPHEDDSQVIGLCAHLVSLVLELIVQRRVAEEESNRDPLTGLWNRRGIMSHLPALLSSSERHGERLVLAVVDVNSLKNLNDVGGHQAGDRALREVAEALVSSVRGGDLVGRWGGDEFVLLFQAQAKDARTVARRLMLWIHQRCGRRVSIGCAAWGVDGSDWDSCFAVADQRCYRVKQAGQTRRRRALLS